jgi:para-nitrobenzyl esterase
MEKVKIDTGYVTGTVMGEPGREVRIYKSIPYAAPPVGELRWKPPQPIAPWSGVRECTTFCDFAPQSFSPLPGTLPGSRSIGAPIPRLTARQSEDCLYLNVLTPAKKDTDRLPVMVWIHGGGFIMGSANEPISNLPRLPSHGVVLVNINMRLGPIGLLAHPLLSRESTNGVSGNYMLLDCIAGLKWVRNNIAQFGGDPNNITIFGESGGAAKVISLMASPQTKGLFHRSIAESAAPDGRSLKELEERGTLFFARLGVDKETDPLKAARALPWQKIMEVERDLIQELHVTGRGGLWDVAVDGWFMPETPLNVFKAGKQQPVPYVLHANLGELSTRVGAYLIPAYLGLFSGAAKTGVKAHAVIFDRVPEGWRKEGCVSCHAIELGYVFGDWDNSSGFFPGLMTIAGPAGAKSPNPGLSAKDKEVSELMMRIWTQYAASGDPNIKGMVNWPVWDQVSDRYLFIGDQPEVRTNYSQLASLFKNS